MGTPGSVKDQTILEFTKGLALKWGLRLVMDPAVDDPGIVLVDHPGGTVTVHPDAARLTLHQNTVGGTRL